MIKGETPNEWRRRVIPKSSQYALLWSEEQQQYELHLRGQLHQRFPAGESDAFSRWLGEQTSFAFAGQAGWLSVIKEDRAAGTGYWYAYRTQDRHTRKRYLGPTSKVTFARLEEAASRFAPVNASKEQARSTASQQQKTFLSIKLSPPRVPHVLVERPRLLRDLDAICTYPLTLVSASAGSGKTTLLSPGLLMHRRRLHGSAKPPGRRGTEATLRWPGSRLMEWRMSHSGSGHHALQRCKPACLRLGKRRWLSCTRQRVLRFRRS